MSDMVVTSLSVDCLTVSEPYGLSLHLVLRQQGIQQSRWLLLVLCRIPYSTLPRIDYHCYSVSEIAVSRRRDQAKFVDPATDWHLEPKCP